MGNSKQAVTTLKICGRLDAQTLVSLALDRRGCSDLRSLGMN